MRRRADTRGPRVPVGLALALCLVAAALLPVAHAAEDEAIAAAEAHVAAGRLEAAREVLEEALEAEADQDARAPARHALLARVLEGLGEPFAALQHHEAVAEQRGAPEDHLAYGRALLAVARSNIASGQASSLEVVPFLLDAIAAAERAEAAGAEAAARWALEAEARYWQGDLESAVAAWQHAPLDALPEGEAVRQHELLAHALYALGRHAESAAAFAVAGNVRGEASAWAAAGEGPRAIEAYGRLLAATPDDAELLEAAWAAARYTGEEAALADVLATLDVAEADRPRVLLVRARLAEALGETAAAERLLEAAASASDEIAAVEALVALGRLRARRASVAGDQDGLDAAVDAWLEALAAAPRHEDLLVLLWDEAGRSYRAAWRSPPALARTLRIQRALVEADPEDGLAWANLGNTLRLAGEAEEAVAAYDRAVDLRPEDPAVFSDRGLALSALGRGEEALASWRRAVALDERFDAAHQNAARHLFLAGRYEEAARHLEAALDAARRAGQGADRYRHLLDRLLRAERREDAR